MIVDEVMFAPGECGRRIGYVYWFVILTLPTLTRRAIAHITAIACVAAVNSIRTPRNESFYLLRGDLHWLIVATTKAVIAVRNAWQRCTVTQSFFASLAATLTVVAIVCLPIVVKLQRCRFSAHEVLQRPQSWVKSRFAAHESGGA